MQIPARVLLTIGLLVIRGGSTEAGFVFAGDHVLLPNQANQVISIFASPSFAGELAPGFNLNLVIDDGGSVVGGVDNNAPKITAVNLKPVGGLFAGIPDVQTVVFPSQKLFQVTIASTNLNSRPEITANALLAQVTFDTTGLTTSNWALRLNGIPGILPASDFAGNVTTITNGTLRINAVPEPSTLALLCCTSFAAVFLRKRRANWLYKSRDV